MRSLRSGSRETSRIDESRLGISWNIVSTMVQGEQWSGFLTTVATRLQAGGRTCDTYIFRSVIGSTATRAGSSCISHGITLRYDENSVEWQLGLVFPRCAANYRLSTIRFNTARDVDKERLIWRHVREEKEIQKNSSDRSCCSSVADWNIEKEQGSVEKGWWYQFSSAQIESYLEKGSVNERMWCALEHFGQEEHLSCTASDQDDSISSRYRNLPWFTNAILLV